MNRMALQRALGVAAGLTIGCAGLRGADAADLYAFQAPAGWQAFTHSNLGNREVAIWRGPTDAHFGENILLIVKPMTQTLDAISQVDAVASGLPGAKGSRRSMTVCGGHPAMYVYVTAPFRGHTLISENVISVWNNVGYSATYSRLDYQQTVSGARSALTTLCPPGLSTSKTSW
jgi:hypothetical protein